VAIDEAIDDNAELAMAIFENGLESFGGSNTSGDPARQPLWKGTATPNDIEKARSTLRQFYRDWSKEGEAERKACFEPVMIDLKEERASSGKETMTVLVPGAGLGRFVFDLCCDGFRTEGNEISYHQLLASSYILNCCPEAEKHKLHPWVHSFSNHKHRSRQLQTIKVPDVHPGRVLEKLAETQNQRQPGDMSMSASDFICLYGDNRHRDAFDAVATVFFIDTSPNLIRYIQTIQNCLKTGGIWTNLGPLLWHFENSAPGSNSNTVLIGDSVASTGKCN
jgi:carnosine N-methyltransferase